MSFRLGLAFLVAALASPGAAAQGLNCSPPNFCIWVDDDTCGRCVDGGFNALPFTCRGDADCIGIGSGVCAGTCVNDHSIACLFLEDCAAVGGACDLTKDGAGSQADPYCRIQTAYDAAVNAGTPTSPANPYIIPVQPGTYQECVSAWGFIPDADGFWDPNLSQDLPVKLRAVDFVNNGRNDTTIIDGTGHCDTLSDNPDSVVKLGGTGAVLEGFTITGGARSGVAAQGEVAITNSIISGNDSELGGGIYFLSASCYYLVNVDAVIADNVIENNHSKAPLAVSEPACQVCLGPGIAPCGTGDGGGIFAAVDDRGSCGATDSVVISGNTVRNNTAQNFNLDPCTSICENSPDPFDPIVCGELPDPDCPAGTEPCVAQIPYTSSGGGIFVLTDSSINRAADATITQNLIAGNAIVANSPTDFAEGYGGGIYAVTFGTGADTIEISDNCVGGTLLSDCASDAVSGNFSTLDGGGITARARPFVDGRHTIDVDGNTVTGNLADRDGGGLELLTEAIELSTGSSGDLVRLRMTGNDVTNNESGRDAGGVKAVSDVRRTTRADATELTLSIQGNTISDNTSGLGAGGALLIPIADADDFSSAGCGPNPRPAESRIDFAQNLVVDNFASATDPGTDVIGGGILSLPLTFGIATATVVIDQTTIAGNSVGPNGLVGGVETQAVTYSDCLTGADSGESHLVLDRSIVANNTCPGSTQCIGVGGPPLGLDVLIADATSCEVFGHNPNYESSLFPANPPAGNITGNPLLNASTYFPDACSPAFSRFCHGDLASCSVDGDCGGFCSAFSTNPLDPCTLDAECPNGSCLARCVDAVGFYGNPDTTADGSVDGQEILAIAASFGAVSGVDPRFDAAADINRNGLNDGDDLSFFTSEFGETCAP